MVPNAPASGAFQHRTDMATGECYSGVVKVPMTIPKTKIPASETNHLCYTFDVPSDREYHLGLNIFYYKDNTLHK